MANKWPNMFRYFAYDFLMIFVTKKGFPFVGDSFALMVLVSQRHLGCCWRRDQNYSETLRLLQIGLIKLAINGH